MSIKTAPAPDQSALVTIGRAVRARLADDPSVYKVPVDEAELFAVGQFLDARECARIIAIIDEVARPSTLFEDVAREGYRTSYSGDVDPNDTFVRMIERRLCDLIGIDMTWGETFQGQRYGPGQEFREHCDWFDPNAAYWQDERNSGGQRSWTAMVYLNEVEEGGETEFTKLGLSIPPQTGSLLLWNNARPDGTPNLATMHAGLPVTRGVKYIITKWFRTRAWN